MSILEAIVLGLVQGLTEFIPVSSSGHLIAGHELFGSTESTLLFDVALHVGTLCALLLFFWKDIISLVRNILAKNNHGKLARLLVIGTIPAAVIGFLAADWIDDVLRKPLTVVVTMTIMGLLMLVVEQYSKKDKKLPSLNVPQSIIIGFSQALALIPGVSRSGATITTGMALGFTRSDAARFSFLLAIPITCGAIAGSLISAENGELAGQAGVFVAGILAAMVSGFFAIRFLIAYLSKHSLRVFAYYRLVFAAGLLLVLMVK